MQLEEYLWRFARELVHMLREQGFLQKKEGTKCPKCGKGVLGKLCSTKAAGHRHRCNKWKCQAYVLPHEGHPIFTTGRGTGFSSLTDQAAVLFCAVAGAKQVTSHHLVDKNHKMIHDIFQRLDDCRTLVVEKEEKDIIFGKTILWADVEGDEVDLGKKEASIIDKDQPKRTMDWEQWQGLVERGDRKTLVLSRTRSEKTHLRAPGPGPIKKSDWQPIANRYLKN